MRKCFYDCVTLGWSQASCLQSHSRTTHESESFHPTVGKKVCKPISHIVSRQSCVKGHNTLHEHTHTHTPPKKKQQQKKKQSPNTLGKPPMWRHGRSAQPPRHLAELHDIPCDITFQTTTSHSRPGVRVPACTPCCTRCGWTADFMLPRSVTAMQCKPGQPPPPPPHTPLLPPSPLPSATPLSTSQSLSTGGPPHQHHQRQLRADDMQQTALSTVVPSRRMIDVLSDRDGNTWKHSERTCLSC